MQKIETLILTFALAFGAVAVQASTPGRAASSEPAHCEERPAALDRGRELFDFGHWTEARLHFRQALETLHPANEAGRIEAEYYLAACGVELRLPDAEAALKRFERRYPGSIYENDVRLSLASYYCSVGDMTRAHDYFSQVNYNALGRQSREQYDIRMGYVLFSRGDHTAAYNLFGRVGSRSRYSDHARYYRAYIDYAEGRTGLAKQEFTALLQSPAYKDVAPYYLLQLEFREGNYRYVVEKGDALVAQSVPERRAELERIIAESWFRLEEYNNTLTHLERYEAAGGQADRAENYLRGFSLYRTARYDEASDCLRRACGPVDSLTQNASYHLADCALRTGDKQGAMQAFALAADETLDPVIAEDALFNYAKLQYELGGGVFNGAINLLSRYLERYPATERAPEARELLIAAYHNSRNYEAAYQAIKTMPMPDGELRAILQKITYFRALEAYKAGDHAAARRYLAESAAIDVSPKYGSLTTFWQGEIAFAEGDHTGAAAKYNAYLRRAPRTEREYALAHYNLGYCSFSRQEMAQAGSAFEKFLSLYTTQDSYRADALNRLGDVRYAQRSFEKAVGEYDRAIALATPERHYARYQRAVTFGILGRTTEKLQLLRQIIAEGQGDYLDLASYELGRSYIAEERYAEGARQLEQFIERYPTSPHRPQALSALGLAYLNLGERDKALKYYDMVVEASPRSAEAKEAMQGIREIYVSDGDAEGYFAYAEQAGVESDLSALSRDSLSFAAAQKLYLDDRMDAAEKSLRSYVKSYPKGYYRTDALYYLSDCYLRRSDKANAIETLTELSNEGNNRYTVQVLDHLSSLTWEAARYDEAARAYRRLYDVTPTAAGREKAMTGYVRSVVATGDAQQLAAAVTDLSSKADAGKTALREVKYAWATHLRGEGRTAEALPIYKELAVEVATKEGSEAGYRLIEAQFESGDLKGSEKAIFAYSEREPQAYWLAKAFLVLGDIYAKEGDTFQARATWQSVADGYLPIDDGIVDAAKERIRKLNE